MIQVSCTMGFCGCMDCTLRAVYVFVWVLPLGLHKNALRVEIPYTLEAHGTNYCMYNYSSWKSPCLHTYKSSSQSLFAELKPSHYQGNNYVV